MGLNTSLLMWMQFHAHVEHLGARVARPVESVLLTEDSVFTLTRRGLEFAKHAPRP
jgi:hypothetical protein